MYTHTHGMSPSGQATEHLTIIWQLLGATVVTYQSHFDLQRDKEIKTLSNHELGTQKLDQIQTRTAVTLPASQHQGNRRHTTCMGDKSQNTLLSSPGREIPSVSLRIVT